MTDEEVQQCDDQNRRKALTAREDDAASSWRIDESDSGSASLDGLFTLRTGRRAASVASADPVADADQPLGPGVTGNYRL